MKKYQKTINGIFKSIARTMMDKDTREWPPTCGAFLYQPSRPLRDENNNKATEEPNTQTNNVFSSSAT